MRRILQLILTLLTNTSIFDIGLPDKSGIAGLAVEQNDGTDSGLALHAPLEVEMGLLEGAHVIYNSVASITNTGPVEFLVPRDNESSFILSQSRHSGHFVVTNDDGGFVTPESKATLVNHFAACLFSQVEVYLNGVRVADLSSAVTYPWRMFIQSFLSYNFDVKDSYLSTEGFYNENISEVTSKEIPAKFETYSLQKRKKLMSNEFFNTRIAVDLFDTDQFLPPNVDIKIKLVRSAETFGLLQDPTAAKPFKIVLKDVKLHMRKVLPTLMLRESFKNKLLKEPCYLPFSATRLRHYVIPQGVSSFNIANIANGTLPKQVFFVMVHNQAMSHAPNKNPFNFQHFNLSSFILKKNGQCVFPKPFQPNIEVGDAVDLYRHLYDSIGISHGNQSIGLSYEALINGRFFLAANLTPDQCNLYHIHPENYGNLYLELAFSKITPQPIYVLALSIFNSGIKITCLITCPLKKTCLMYR